MLPLRSAAIALDKKIDWLDGLILIGDESVDLQHPQTLAIKDKIKMELTDKRKRIEYTKAAIPITKYGNTIYFYNEATGELFRKADGQKVVKVQVPGKPNFFSAKVIGDELYYTSEVNGVLELYAFDFVKNISKKICTLDGGHRWLEDVRFTDNELYVSLHNGELTLGHAVLYKIENGTPKEVLSTKDLINFVKAGKYIYFTDFSINGGPENNLYRVDTKTGEKQYFGEEGFAYGINRTIEEGGGISYWSNGGMYVKDGYLYTLAYKETDPKDESSVYKINLADRTQVKLTSPAKDFWMENNQIYYIETSTGYLKRVDLNGGNDRVVVERNVPHAKFYNGNIYYTSNANKNVSNIGVLYRYNIANKLEVKLSDKPMSSYYVGKDGVYFVSDGYEPGLFKIRADGRVIPLVTDNVDKVLLADAGIVYTLAYKEGIYSGK
ncbi:DUF5050 domain-containing protein [Paenibacillus alkalitolerans]|uniref:DUF5050 domain-containing protein n=1 Tax=Paenibacillus alkalitolerans TaxID=2799335 RepID=UPI0018F2CE01|nr:DUF5050 domain-containing protein [Paenibacillus alkalitolerans]